MKKRGEKLVALFIDLKAAFDKVDREVLMGRVEEEGMRKRLIVRLRIEEIYRDTGCLMRIN